MVQIFDIKYRESKEVKYRERVDKAYKKETMNIKCTETINPPTDIMQIKSHYFKMKLWNPRFPL